MNRKPIFKQLPSLFLLLLCSIYGFAQNVNEAVIGTQNLAVLPFDYALDSNHQSLAELEAGFFSSEFSIKNFIEEISYGKATIEGVVYPYRRDQPPLFGMGYTNCFPVDEVIANQADVDYIGIDNLVLQVHDTISKLCPAGNSSFGKLPFSTKDGDLNFRRSGFRTRFYTPYEFSGITNSTVAHELIHSFGISYHSNSYINDDGQLSIQAYGNLFDIMGLRSQASHPCALIKEQKGWLTENEMTQVQNTDTFRIYPLEQKLPGQTQCLVIDLANDLDLQPNDEILFSKLYIEYRGMTGFDERNRRNIRLKNGDDFSIDNPHGALIHGIDCQLNDDFCIPVLLDMHLDPIGGEGAAYLPHEASDAQLFLNETYEVANNDITITVTKIEPGQFIDVYVEFNTVNAPIAENLADISVYPNPASSRIQIDGLEATYIQTRIYSMFGSLVLFKNGTSIIDISTLPEGVYLMEIMNTNSRQKRVEKIAVFR